jgi:hypothetical protein
MSAGGGSRLALAAVAAVVVLTAALLAVRALLSPGPADSPARAEGETLRDTPWPSAAPAASVLQAPGTTGAAAMPPGPPAPAVATLLDRDVALAAARGDAAAAGRLAKAMQAGDPRAYAYSALYCVPGSGCDPAPGERAVALAASQVRAGLAIRSGDPEAVYHAGLAIAQSSLGRNPLRGAAWMLVACRRGYRCAAPDDLDRAWSCAGQDAACRAATTVEDRLQAVLGAAQYARAFTLADEYAAQLDAGELPESAVAYGSY